ncbi:PP2C family protein-serine/threonine phosphatase [Streptomyces sp. NPDC056154]|uniref:PP2C family protein-serine/threonine phosphatase n=1 Tax=unclassified Streptomyces TaxID=2593676 RepID=UPI0035DE74D9
MGIWRRLSFRQHSWRASDALLAIPLALIAAIVIVDATTGPDVALGPLLIVAPALTASFAGPLLTAVVGAIAVAALFGVGVGLRILTTESIGTQIVAVVVVSAIVTAFRWLRDRYGRELAQVRTVSEATQRAVLRPLPRQIGPLRVASVYLAAEEQAQIGGDLYAATRTSAGTRLIIGDARGKGLTAIGDAALLLGAFRAAAHRQSSLPDLMAYLENSVCWSMVEPAESEQEGECFITAAVIDIPDAGEKVEMISCGHPPPLLLRDGRVTALNPTRPTLPLGLGELTTPQYQVDTFALGPADLLLLYTDGVIEARDSGRIFYPLAERAASQAHDNPRALIHHLRADLLAHVGGHLDDDAAMVCVQRSPAPAPATPTTAGTRPGLPHARPRSTTKHSNHHDRRRPP